MLRVVLFMSVLMLGSTSFAAGKCKAVSSTGAEHYDVVAITSNLADAQAACEGYNNCTAFCTEQGFRCKGTPKGHVEVVDTYFGDSAQDVADTCAAAGKTCKIVCGSQKTTSKGGDTQGGGKDR